MIPTAMLAVAYATGRAAHARQVKGDDPDKKGYPGPPGWGFGVGLIIPRSKKLIVTKVEKRKSWMDLMMMERVGDRWEKIEGSCSTGQSPQWAVVPMEEEEWEQSCVMRTERYDDANSLNFVNAPGMKCRAV
jgi:hypothetical protein